MCAGAIGFPNLSVGRLHGVDRLNSKGKKSPGWFAVCWQGLSHVEELAKLSQVVSVSQTASSFTVTALHVQNVFGTN